jgi:malonyl-CoA O-methyltransferase
VQARAASRVARRFDRHADTYDDHAAVQARMAGRVAALAAGGPRGADVLELGCGTGVLTALLAQALPEARITAVDVAPRMVARARQRVNGTPVAFLVADVEELAWPAERFDLVVSSATLQWLSRPAETLVRLARALRPGGRMVHATFGPDTFRELHAAFRTAEEAAGLPRRRHWLELAPAHAWRRALVRAGLTAVGCEERWERREYGSCRELLETIKATGASASSDAGPTPRRVLADALRRYDEAFQSPGGVYATYHVLTLTAKRVPGTRRLDPTRAAASVSTP